MRKIFLFATVLLFSLSVKGQQIPEHIMKLMYTGNIIDNFYVDDADSEKITEEGF